MPQEELSELAVQIERISALDLFFVVGMPRSGTTWLQRLLDRHGQVCCKGEAHFVDIFFANVQKAYKDYNKTVKKQGGVIAHLKEYGGHVDTLGFDNHDLQLLLYYGIYLMLAKWVESDDIKVVGEKTPDNIMSMNLLATMFPKARFLHIIRDGRDCAVSAWFFNLSGVDKNKTITERYDSYIDKYLKQWKPGVQFARSIGQQIGERYREVHYESLLSNAQENLQQIFEFLGVDHSADIVSSCVNGESFEKLGNGRLPGQEDRNSFFRKGAAGDWRNHFDNAMAERAWCIAGEKLSELGYTEN